MFEPGNLTILSSPALNFLLTSHDHITVFDAAWRSLEEVYRLIESFLSDARTRG